MTDVDRKTKNIVVRCLRPYKGYGLLRERERVAIFTGLNALKHDCGLLALREDIALMLFIWI